MYREKGLALLKCSVDGHSLGYRDSATRIHKVSVGRQMIGLPLTAETIILNSPPPHDKPRPTLGSGDISLFLLILNATKIDNRADVGRAPGL
ncbi:hypothetical protein PoMZ_06327 [Pyricularia oryzae]|uniref:Uncharacterized protein n=1 Tax=Pyricularia oryzae TaxID=318829 RepID=A0A4P7NQR2_PYROR|nr:hypothetical protein PoMZ_06327 [Pyricularia oryzae]